MTQYNKPLPEITLLTEPFWQGTKEHQLRLQRCDDCGAFRFIPKEVCPSCASVQATWTPVNGNGKVYSYSTVYRGTGSAFQEDLPFIVVMVELAEGPRMISHLIDCAPDQVQIDMPVAVVFEEATPEVTLYKFRPA